MRLFIGIKTGCESHLLSLQHELKRLGKGNFTDARNLHITLKFLGEVPPGKVGSICEAMAETHAKAFGLECRGVAQFYKSGIVSAKVVGNLKTLSALHASLETALEKRGLKKDQRPYRPHITLARQFHAFAGMNVEEIPCTSCGFKVEEIVLFESKREGGRLVYEPLFVKRLG
ncbi:MAG: RNA 2',3'-cyclic phosphodiesterase [Eubacteriales bacterium]|nr:RNA 2',3'-cyclic phosphodiesterase [Eubacteriales bacterium]